MPSEAVRFANVYKTFAPDSAVERLRTIVAKLKAGSFRGYARQKNGEIALQDISFTVKKGERVGILGPNGAGKSTILKMINNVMDPSSGSITVDGTVGGLLEVGAGFQPNLTCLENVIINLTFQKFTTKEAYEVVDKVFELAELSHLKNATFKNLSSGMGIRLGFMTALVSQPDIVLLDEVLGVGDQRFQARSRHMLEAFLDGKTTILVSHSMPQVRRICDRVIVLCDRKIVYDGDVDGGIEAYYEGQNAHALQDEEIIYNSAHGIHKPPESTISQLEYYVGSRQTTEFEKGDEPLCRLLIEEQGEVLKEKTLCLTLNKMEFKGLTTILYEHRIPLACHTRVFSWTFETKGLLPGAYFFAASIDTHQTAKSRKTIVQKYPFRIVSSSKRWGAGLMDVGFRADVSASSLMN